MGLTLTLLRTESSDQGTFGELLTQDDQRLAYTLEPPWRHNERNLSCILTGTYPCLWAHSPHFGWVYHVTQVPGRGNILIHSGNFGGDTGKGFKTHTKGCLLLGTRLGILGRQKAVLASRLAVHNLAEWTKQQDFTLKIKEY